MVANIYSKLTTEQEFKDHTKQITLRVVQLVEKLPNTQKAQLISNQLLMSAASIGAHYRAACRRKSADGLIRKLIDVEDEAVKTLYWLEVLVELKIIEKERLAVLSSDLDEIVNMAASSINALRHPKPKSVK